ncbi:reverse transcriptase family protein [Alcanivorax sp.]|uniref:reverse transcriptase family protein n=1 Tax=Alcanivorax sp. TaxID=1872427 RepID=UPI0025BC6EA4|nr:reverse transcriptase family protein [Alcanivorax sp.]
MWSSQSYKKKGLKYGRPISVLKNGIEQTEAVLDHNDQLPSILTLKHLSERTGVSLENLRSFVSRENENSYTKFSIAKRSGGRRFIRVPSPPLNHVQKWIHSYILSLVKPNRASFAFVKGKSIRDCAEMHCGATWLIKFDIVNFFESISEIQVFNVFNSLGYQPLVSFELARLCTVATPNRSPRAHYKNWHVIKCYKAIKQYEQSLLGYLPQGAPTSPALSNLVMSRCDEILGGIAKEFDLQYTRYSDDITFSTCATDFSRGQAKEVIRRVNKVLSRQGYLPNYKKVKIVPIGAKKIVLGLNVDGDFPRLQKEFKDRLRQHIYYLQKVGPVEHVLARGFDSIWGFKSHLRGLIDYAKMIEPRYAEKMMEEFNKVDWPF